MGRVPGMAETKVGSLTKGLRRARAAHPRSGLLKTSAEESCGSAPADSRARTGVTAPGARRTTTGKAYLAGLGEFGCRAARLSGQISHLRRRFRAVGSRPAARCARRRPVRLFGGEHRRLLSSILPVAAGAARRRRFSRRCRCGQAAGFRACLRCRPNGPSHAERRAEAVAAACRLIEAAEELPGLDALAAAAGMSRFHFTGFSRT